MQIARSILLQFMNLGANGTGSYAQSVDQSGFFLMALKAVGDSICDTINRYAIPQMVDYNWDVKKYPKLTMSGLEKWEILSYASAVAQLVNVGALGADEGIEDELRRLLKFPPRQAPPTAEKPETEHPALDKTGVNAPKEANFDKSKKTAGKEGDAAENIAEGAKLNGIQIQASMEVLWSFINGNVPETVAVELLVAVGIDRERATSMVKACKGFKPENPTMLTPGKTEKQFKEKILSVILAEPTSPRQPRGCEIYMAVEDIEKKLDSSQRELISSVSEVQRRQIAQITESAMKDIREGRLSKFLETKIPWRDQMEATVYKTLLDLFTFGKEQVANELKRQRGIRKMAEPVQKPTPTEVLKARAKAVTETLATKLHAAMTWEALRQSKAGEADQQIFASTLMNLSAHDLEMVAQFSVNEAFSMGREDEAHAHGDITRVVYSALMDRFTCEACEELDGNEYQFPSAEWDEVVPPYKNCEGRDRCRCVGVYVYSDETEGA
jgi:hypothetical protein